MNPQQRSGSLRKGRSRVLLHVRKHLVAAAALSLLSSGCYQVQWKLDIITDEIHFRSVQDYPESLWTFYRVLRTYQALARLFEADRNTDSPMLVEYGSKRDFPREFEVFLPEESTPTDVASAAPDSGGEAPGEHAATLEEKVAAIYEISRLLFATEFPDHGWKPWLREGLATYLQYGSVVAEKRRFDLPDLGEFLSLTRSAAAAAVPAAGDVFRASSPAFEGPERAEYLYRAALIVGFHISRSTDRGFRGALEALVRFSRDDLRRLEEEALRAARGQV